MQGRTDFGVGGREEQTGGSIMQGRADFGVEYREEHTGGIEYNAGKNKL